MTMTAPNKKKSFAFSTIAVWTVLVSAGAKAQDVSFVAQRRVAVGDFPQRIAAGDFNGDGLLDVVVTNRGLVSVLFGNRNGGFPTPLDSPTRGAPHDAPGGEFHGEGLLG